MRVRAGGTISACASCHARATAPPGRRLRPPASRICIVDAILRCRDDRPSAGRQIRAVPAFLRLRRFARARTRPGARSRACWNTVLRMIEQGATHVGVATDHVIESFATTCGPATRPATDRAGLVEAIPSPGRSACGDGYQGLAGRARGRRRARLRRALRLRGRARAESMHLDPDKDLAQCGEDRVQMDRRSGAMRMQPAEGEVRRRPRAHSRLPGARRRRCGRISRLVGLRAKGAATLLNKYGPIENIPLDSRRPARGCAALQEAGDAGCRCAGAAERRRIAVMARSADGIRGARRRIDSRLVARAERLRPA